MALKFTEKKEKRFESTLKGSYSLGLMLKKIKNITGRKYPELERELKALKLVERRMALGDKDARERFGVIRKKIWKMMMGAIADAQTKLKDLKLYKGKIDGVWGKGSEAACKKYMSKRRITSKNKGKKKVQENNKINSKEEKTTTVIIYDEEQILKGIDSFSNNKEMYYGLLFKAYMAGNISENALRERINREVYPEYEESTIRKIREVYKKTVREYLKKMRKYIHEAMMKVKELTRVLEEVGIKVPRISLEIRVIENDPRKRRFIEGFNNSRFEVDPESTFKEARRLVNKLKEPLREYLLGTAGIEEIQELRESTRDSPDILGIACSNQSYEFAINADNALENIDLQDIIYKRMEKFGRITNKKVEISNVWFYG